MEDRRQALIDAGLQILREEGLAGFTQPKVAARVGLRQGNLTYYFPTRSDLLCAVARAAVDGQLAAADALVRTTTGVGGTEKAIATLGALVTRHETTRVLVSLAQAADQEPAVRTLFNELADGLMQRLGELMTKLGIETSPARLDLVHSLLVGLAVVDLATGRRNNKARVKVALDAAFQLLIEPARSPARR
ncbi:TetR family transcriptional regulator [Variovorax sp. J31P207]|uniref:TetR/AcrR family transcriptional regulator n=1 Tax=Variovorax sp. J31P207 TaxID=3053510 RepID=UPI002578249E|nr:TetR family transcriptional regulator [Variovorax sp. J31P207]MDM0070546.1 TetR family transcriptional regulator [Variovorax sp. J31P207]